MSIKERFPLAFAAIEKPVKYSAVIGQVIDARGRLLLEVRGWGWLKYKPYPKETQDEIGKMIEALINEAK